MEKEFVTYEIALKLKELGFNEPCWFQFDQNGRLDWCYTIMKIETSKTTIISSCLAPLWQQVIDWFREKHNINLYLPKSVYGGYVYVVDSKYSDTIYNDYYDAREQAILKAIELCKNN